MLNHFATSTDRHRVHPFVCKLRNGAVLTSEDEAILTGLANLTRPIERGDILRQGAQQRSIVLVVEGWLCRYTQLENGKRQITAIFIPGDLCQPFGATPRVLDHSLAALTPAMLSFMPPQLLLNTARSNPRIEEALWWDLLKSDALTREHVVSLGRRSATERLGHFFCEMRERLAMVGLVEGDSFDLPLTQVDLADLFGLSAVHVNRALQDLRSSGLLSLRSRRATLPDVAGLSELSMFDPAEILRDRTDAAIA